MRKNDNEITRSLPLLVWSFLHVNLLYTYFNHFNLNYNVICDYKLNNNLGFTFLLLFSHVTIVKKT